MYEKFDEIALSYHSANLPDMHIEEACQKFELDWILSYFLHNRIRVLDLGFGDGVNFEAIASRCELTVVEGAKLLCSKALEIATEKNIKANIVHSLFEEFETVEKFDVILASHVLEHVEDPVRLLKHLRKFLHDDGRIVGIVPNSESYHRRLGLAMGLQETLDQLSERDYLVGHQRVYNLARLDEDVQKSGMRIETHRGFFLKVLANSQMIHLGEDVLKGLLKISDQLATEVCANIGFVIASDGVSS